MEEEVGGRRQSVGKNTPVFVPMMWTESNITFLQFTNEET